MEEGCVFFEFAHELEEVLDLIAVLAVSAHAEEEVVPVQVVVFLRIEYVGFGVAYLNGKRLVEKFVRHGDGLELRVAVGYELVEFVYELGCLELCRLFRVGPARGAADDGLVDGFGFLSAVLVGVFVGRGLGRIWAGWR